MSTKGGPWSAYGGGGASSPEWTALSDTDLTLIEDDNSILNGAIAGANSRIQIPVSTDQYLRTGVTGLTYGTGVVMPALVNGYPLYQLVVRFTWGSIPANTYGIMCYLTGDGGVAHGFGVGIFSDIASVRQRPISGIVYNNFGFGGNQILNTTFTEAIFYFRHYGFDGNANFDANLHGLSTNVAERMYYSDQGHNGRVVTDIDNSQLIFSVLHGSEAGVRTETLDFGLEYSIVEAFPPAR